MNSKLRTSNTIIMRSSHIASLFPRGKKGPFSHSFVMDWSHGKSDLRTKTASGAKRESKASESVRLEHFLALGIVCYPALRLEESEILCHERHVTPLSRCLTARAADIFGHIVWFRHELCVAHDMRTLWSLVAENLGVYCGCTNDQWDSIAKAKDLL